MYLMRERTRNGKKKDMPVIHLLCLPSGGKWRCVTWGEKNKFIFYRIQENPHNTGGVQNLKGGKGTAAVEGLGSGAFTNAIPVEIF